jgi:hypothetical protein
MPTEVGCTIVPDANGNVVIPITWSIIPSKAFYQCSNLKSVTFPSNTIVTEIEDDAFAQSALESFKLPDTVITIGNSVFQNTKNLNSFTITTNSKLKSLGFNCFQSSNVGGNIFLPNSIATLNAGTFDKCIRLHSVTFGSSGSITGSGGLQTIDNNAFSNSGIKSLTLPMTVSSIGSNSFSGCTK